MDILQVGKMKPDNQSMMTPEEVEQFLDREFPEANYHGKTYDILGITAQGAKIRLLEHERHLRPGGTISGPAMMALTDICAYVSILGNIGPVALTVTTNLNINFVRKPKPGNLIAVGEIIKLGRTLAVVDIRIMSEGIDLIVAHSSVTYAIPKQ